VRVAMDSGLATSDCRDQRHAHT